MQIIEILWNVLRNATWKMHYIFRFYQVELDIPLEEQGPFDLIIQKVPDYLGKAVGKELGKDEALQMLQLNLSIIPFHGFLKFWHGPVGENPATPLQIAPELVKLPCLKIGRATLSTFSLQCFRPLLEDMATLALLIFATFLIVVCKKTQKQDLRLRKSENHFLHKYVFTHFLSRTFR